MAFASADIKCVPLSNTKLAQENKHYLLTKPDKLALIFLHHLYIFSAITFIDEKLTFNSKL
jgi:hypothetical protein